MKKIAEFYKALGDETRLKIIQMLLGHEMCVCEIIDKLDMSQPAISHHLKILRQAGLVKDSREGKWIYYSLNDRVFEDVFTTEDTELISSYAAPIKRRLENQQKLLVRTDPSICETLTKRQKRAKCQAPTKRQQNSQ